ncbi:hypothetical protein GUJ93_ZPchr0016g2518 [Zizania palustris]|uniref:Uncharacterized protein n=1 Tax=Zizania palustris TaxID=103762 RepID=A0A8J5SZ11_ZIZPA|nr:hypothetical protein GUJ93_ZPchr0016g2518 [Zizania palustris]
MHQFEVELEVEEGLRLAEVWMELGEEPRMLEEGESLLESEVEEMSKVLRPQLCLKILLRSKLKSTEIAKASRSGIGCSLPQSMALVSGSSSGTSSGGKRGEVAKRMAWAFVAELSDIDNTSSEDPTSDEDEPDEKKEKMKDFNGLYFMANCKQSSDEPDISEGGDAD